MLVGVLHVFDWTLSITYCLHLCDNQVRFCQPLQMGIGIFWGSKNELKQDLIWSVWLKKVSMCGLSFNIVYNGQDQLNENGYKTIK